jgi:HAD superfamily hydrolase (TIGR01509 family)
MIAAVIFDMDGVLVESEQYWDAARGTFVAAHGGHWTAADQVNVMGHNTAQWCAYLRERFGIALDDAAIVAEVLRQIKALYQQRVPLLPGAVEAVQRAASCHVVGVASSSPLELITFVLELTGLRPYIQAIASSDEVPRGKPDPAVYRLAAERLGIPPSACLAVEDSPNGVRAAHAAGMRVIAVPNPTYTPDDPAFQLAEAVRNTLVGWDPCAVR